MSKPRPPFFSLSVFAVSDAQSSYNFETFVTKEHQKTKLYQPSASSVRVHLQLRKNQHSSRVTVTTVKRALMDEDRPHWPTVHVTDSLCDPGVEPPLLWKPYYI